MLRNAKFLLLAAWFSSGAGAALAQDDASFARRGEALLASNCSRCHAIGRSGDSTHPEAPPFRSLGRRYPIESLAEALGEGLVTGHPDMPEFVFEVADVGAILAYMQSIQGPSTRPPSKR
jgi:mono/diheme cytochrome c family protein